MPALCFDPTLAELLQCHDFLIWNDDAEYVYVDANHYASTLGHLRTISRNVFNPTDIQETWRWRGDLPIIELSFSLHGQQKTIYLRRYGDYLDLRFLHIINRLIEYSGFRFVQYTSTAGERFIMMLSSSEQALVEIGPRFDARAFSQSEIVEFIVWQAEERLYLERYVEAIVELSVELSHKPAEPWLYFYRGLAHYERGELESAHTDWALAASNGLSDVHALIRDRYGSRAFCLT